VNYDLNFPRASQIHPASGVIKQDAADFYVEELMNPNLAGDGEHVWLWLEKDGQNTEYVAKQIARYAKVRSMDVGFSGMKDRWAVTRQWFSVYLGAKAAPDWEALELEGVRILKTARHSKKLRRGEHYGNSFVIVVRALEDYDYLESSLTSLKELGFPNYFGLQRFGIQGANLERGELYFEGKIKASRSQRSFYLSAARSFLFNLNLAQAVVNGEWLNNEYGGPLYGDPQPQVAEITPTEQIIFDQHIALVKGLHKNRLRLERRPYRVVPDALEWSVGVDDSVILSFQLPTGVFATSLLDEIIKVTVASGQV